MVYYFNAEETVKKLINGIRKWFNENGPSCNAIIGLSGGKDSLIVAKLCVEALGADRVIGVGLPDYGQGLNEADKIAEWLGIRFHVVNIGAVTNLAKISLAAAEIKTTEQAEQNIPPRVRMVFLYALSQSLNGRVVGTCNASENYIGYFTKYGDGASDFEPIAELTVNELYLIGDELGLPNKWVRKTPDDGLPHSMPDDEKFEKMGFNYEKLDKYIRTGTSGDYDADVAIYHMHRRNMFKLKPVETIKFDF